MSKNPQNAEACIDAWIKWHHARGTSPKTIMGYNSTANLLIRTCRELRITDIPYKWTDSEARIIRNHWINTGLTVKTQMGYDFVLTALAKYFKNELMKIRWPPDPRPNVKWLTLAQVRHVLSTPMTELEETCIHFMLGMGMRRVEVIRMKVSDVNWTLRYITVDGKGHKRRNVPFARDTERVLTCWLARRNELLEIARQKARRKNRRVIDPGIMIVYERAGKLSGYSELHPNGFDDAVVTSVSLRCGIMFDNHTLRRTFGRELYYKEKNPVDLVTLSELLGHESTDQTKRYIGPDPVRMARAMIQTPY